MQLRVLGIPVYVSTAFWVTALVFGLLVSHSGPLAVLWVVVIFVAVVSHELGHAFVGRALGGEPAILLHGLGGSTSLRGAVLTRKSSIAVSLAGPMAGLVLGGLVLLALRFVPAVGLAHQALRMGAVATLGYAGLNLVPALPFDGGLVLRDALGPERGRLSLLLSAGFGAAAGLAFVHFRALLPAVWPLPALWFALATVQSLRGAWSWAGRREEETARVAAAGRELETAIAAAAAGRIADAETRALTALAIALDPALRDRARRLLVELALGKDDGTRALALLGSIEAGAPDDDVARAQALDLVGEREAAFALLEKRTAETPSGPTFEALVRGLLATGQATRAVDVGLLHASTGAVEALFALVDGLIERGDVAPATRVLSALDARAGDVARDPRLARAHDRLRAAHSA